MNTKNLNEKFIIGVVGLYASGKSTVANEFIKMGFYEINVDEYGYKSLKDKKKEIIKTFGSNILTHNEIDRKKLSNIVFKSKFDLYKLNSIVHPYMKSKIKDDIQITNSDKIIIHAALLLDMNLDKLCNKVIAVISNYDDIYKRGRDRDNRNIEQIKFILANQPTPNQLIENADYIINNNSTKEELIDNTRNLIRVLLQEYKNE